MNEKPNEELVKLSELCWKFRRDEGYLKPLPAEYKNKALDILFSGIKPSHISKYLGIPPHSLKDWKKSFESQKAKLKILPEKNYFTEIKTEPNLSTKSNVEKLITGIILSFEKNGIKYEIKNLSVTDLVRVIGNQNVF
jgi:hypothetical protein